MPRILVRGMDFCTENETNIWGLILLLLVSLVLYMNKLTQVETKNNTYTNSSLRSLYCFSLATF